MNMKINHGKKRVRQQQEIKLPSKLFNAWEESSACIPSASNITPSKSENGAFEATEDGVFDLEIDHDLNNSSDLELHSFDNILDEFVVEKAHKDSRIIPGWENITEASTPQLSPKKVKKSSEKRIVKELYATIPKSQLQSYHTPDGTVLILSKNEMIHFHGLMTVTVLYGEIEVFGHILTKNSDDYDLYSPRGSSLLYIKNITEANILVETYLPNYKILNQSNLNKNCAIILCKRLEPLNIRFIEKHISQQIFPKNDFNDCPRVVFQPEGLYNYLKPASNWDKVIKAVEASTIMFLCGGKGVGKSSFMRYLINRLLLKYSAVRVIDLDPGQSEFTIPGCISIVKVVTPIFGGSYSHLLETQRSIISNISIAYDPHRYITAIKHLLCFSFEENIPTLINFMGFTHGIGINILSAAIHLCRPTDVVQIISQNSRNNYASALTPEVVAENAEIFVSGEAISYNLLEMESMCDNCSGWIAEPRHHREMSILSYLSRTIDANSVKTKGILSRIKLSDIKINNLTGRELHPAVVNANLVALCKLEDEKDATFQCFGWGIVRGVDLDEGYLVLLSEAFSFLEEITHIVFNGVTLPPSVYMTPDEVTGLVPYVTEGMLARYGQMPKRARRSVKTE